MAERHNTSVVECVVVFNPDAGCGRTREKTASFVFQDSDCQVKVVQGWETDENRMIKAYLKSNPVVDKNFYVTVLLRKGDKSISYPKSKVTDVDGCFWSSSLKAILKKLEAIDRWNFSMQFCFQTESHSGFDQKNSGQLVLTSPCLRECSSIQRLSDDFAFLFERKYGTDVELKSGEMVIKAHKAILMARSEYFRRILQSSSERRIDLPNIDPASFQQVMRFIYTGQPPNLSFELAKNINKSGMCDAGSLKKLCVQFLTEHLTVQNACECLTLVDDDDPFQERIISYIMENEIPLKIEHWKDFCEQHPRTANVVYGKFCRRLWKKK